MSLRSHLIFFTSFSLASLLAVGASKAADQETIRITAEQINNLCANPGSKNETGVSSELRDERCIVSVDQPLQLIGSDVSLEHDLVLHAEQFEASDTISSNFELVFKGSHVGIAKGLKAPKISLFAEKIELGQSGQIEADNHLLISAKDTVINGRIISFKECILNSQKLIIGSSAQIFSANTLHVKSDEFQNFGAFTVLGSINFKLRNSLWASTSTVKATRINLSNDNKIEFKSKLGNLPKFLFSLGFLMKNSKKTKLDVEIKQATTDHLVFIKNLQGSWAWAKQLITNYLAKIHKKKLQVSVKIDAKNKDGIVVLCDEKIEQSKKTILDSKYGIHLKAPNIKQDGTVKTRKLFDSSQIKIESHIAELEGQISAANDLLILLNSSLAKPSQHGEGSRLEVGESSKLSADKKLSIIADSSSIEGKIDACEFSLKAQEADVGGLVHSENATIAVKNLHLLKNSKLTAKERLKIIDTLEASIEGLVYGSQVQITAIPSDGRVSLEEEGKLEAGNIELNSARTQLAGGIKAKILSLVGEQLEVLKTSQIESKVLSAQAKLMAQINGLVHAKSLKIEGGDIQLNGSLQAEKAFIMAKMLSQASDSTLRATDTAHLKSEISSRLGGLLEASKVFLLSDGTILFDTSGKANAKTLMAKGKSIEAKGHNLADVIELSASEDLEVAGAYLKSFESLNLKGKNIRHLSGAIKAKIVQLVADQIDMLADASISAEEKAIFIAETNANLFGAISSEGLIYVKAKNADIDHENIKGKFVQLEVGEGLKIGKISASDLLKINAKELEIKDATSVGKMISIDVEKAMLAGEVKAGELVSIKVDSIENLVITGHLQSDAWIKLKGNFSSEDIHQLLNHNHIDTNKLGLETDQSVDLEPGKIDKTFSLNAQDIHLHGQMDVDGSLLLKALGHIQTHQLSVNTKNKLSMQGDTVHFKDGLQARAGGDVKISGEHGVSGDALKWRGTKEEEIYTNPVRSSFAILGQPKKFTRTTGEQAEGITIQTNASLNIESKDGEIKLSVPMLVSREEMQLLAKGPIKLSDLLLEQKVYETEWKYKQSWDGFSKTWKSSEGTHVQEGILFANKIKVLGSDVYFKGIKIDSDDVSLHATTGDVTRESSTSRIFETKRSLEFDFSSLAHNAYDTCVQAEQCFQGAKDFFSRKPMDAAETNADVGDSLPTWNKAVNATAQGGYYAYKLYKQHEFVKDSEQPYKPILKTIGRDITGLIPVVGAKAWTFGETAFEKIASSKLPMAPDESGADQSKSWFPSFSSIVPEIELGRAKLSYSYDTSQTSKSEVEKDSLRAKKLKISAPKGTIRFANGSSITCEDADIDALHYDAQGGCYEHSETSLAGNLSIRSALSLNTMATMFALGGGISFDHEHSKEVILQNLHAKNSLNIDITEDSYVKNAKIRAMFMKGSLGNLTAESEQDKSFKARFSVQGERSPEGAKDSKKKSKLELFDLKNLSVDGWVEKGKLVKSPTQILAEMGKLDIRKAHLKGAQVGGGFEAETQDLENEDLPSYQAGFGTRVSHTNDEKEQFIPFVQAYSENKTRVLNKDSKVKGGIFNGPLAASDYTQVNRNFDITAYWLLTHDKYRAKSREELTAQARETDDQIMAINSKIKDSKSDEERKKLVEEVNELHKKKQVLNLRNRRFANETLFQNALAKLKRRFLTENEIALDKLQRDNAYLTEMVKKLEKKDLAEDAEEILKAKKNIQDNEGKIEKINALVSQERQEKPKKINSAQFYNYFKSWFQYLDHESWFQYLDDEKVGRDQFNTALATLEKHAGQCLLEAVMKQTEGQTFSKEEIEDHPAFKDLKSILSDDSFQSLKILVATSDQELREEMLTDIIADEDIRNIEVISIDASPEVFYQLIRGELSHVNLANIVGLKIVSKDDLKIDRAFEGDYVFDINARSMSIEQDFKVWAANIDTVNNIEVASGATVQLKEGNLVSNAGDVIFRKDSHLLVSKSAKANRRVRMMGAGSTVIEDGASIESHNPDASLVIGGHSKNRSKKVDVKGNISGISKILASAEDELTFENNVEGAELLDFSSGGALSHSGKVQGGTVNHNAKTINGQLALSNSNLQQRASGDIDAQLTGSQGASVTQLSHQGTVNTDLQGQFDKVTSQALRGNLNLSGNAEVDYASLTAGQEARVKRGSQFKLASKNTRFSIAGLDRTVVEGSEGNQARVKFTGHDGSPGVAVSIGKAKLSQGSISSLTTENSGEYTHLDKVETAGKASTTSQASVHNVKHVRNTAEGTLSDSGTYSQVGHLEGRAQHLKFSGKGKGKGTHVGKLDLDSQLATEYSGQLTAKDSNVRSDGVTIVKGEARHKISQGGSVSLFGKMQTFLFGSSDKDASTVEGEKDSSLKIGFETDSEGKVQHSDSTIANLAAKNVSDIQIDGKDTSVGGRSQGSATFTASAKEKLDLGGHQVADTVHIKSSDTTISGFIESSGLLDLDAQDLDVQANGVLKASKLNLRGKNHKISGKVFGQERAEFAAQHTSIEKGGEASGANVAFTGDSYRVAGKVNGNKKVEGRAKKGVVTADGSIVGGDLELYEQNLENHGNVMGSTLKTGKDSEVRNHGIMSGHQVQINGRKFIGTAGSQITATDQGQVELNAEHGENSGDVMAGTIIIRGEAFSQKSGRLHAIGGAIDAYVQDLSLDEDAELKGASIKWLAKGQNKVKGKISSQGLVQMGGQKVTTSKSADVGAGQLEVTGNEAELDGNLLSSGNSSVKIKDKLTVKGSVESTTGTLDLSGDRLDTHASAQLKGLNANIESRRGTFDGTLEAEEKFTFKWGKGSFKEGVELRAGHAIIEFGEQVDNAGLIDASDIEITSSRIKNRGQLQSEGELRIDAKDELILDGISEGKAYVMIKAPGGYIPLGKVKSDGMVELYGDFSDKQAFDLVQRKTGNIDAAHLQVVIDRDLTIDQELSHHQGFGLTARSIKIKKDISAAVGDLNFTASHGNVEVGQQRLHAAGELQLWAQQDVKTRASDLSGGRLVDLRAEEGMLHLDGQEDSSAPAGERWRGTKIKGGSGVEMEGTDDHRYGIILESKRKARTKGLSLKSNSGIYADFKDGIEDEAAVEDIITTEERNEGYISHVTNVIAKRVKDLWGKKAGKKVKKNTPNVKKITRLEQRATLTNFDADDQILIYSGGDAHFRGTQFTGKNTTEIIGENEANIELDEVRLKNQKIEKSSAFYGAQKSKSKMSTDVEYVTRMVDAVGIRLDTDGKVLGHNAVICAPKVRIRGVKGIDFRRSDNEIKTKHRSEGLKITGTAEKLDAFQKHGLSEPEAIAACKQLGVDFEEMRKAKTPVEQLAFLSAAASSFHAAGMSALTPEGILNSVLSPFGLSPGKLASGGMPGVSGGLGYFKDEGGSYQSQTGEGGILTGDLELESAEDINFMNGYSVNAKNSKIRAKRLNIEGGHRRASSYQKHREASVGGATDSKGVEVSGSYDHCKDSVDYVDTSDVNFGDFEVDLDELNIKDARIKASDPKGRIGKINAESTTSKEKSANDSLSGSAEVSPGAIIPKSASAAKGKSDKAFVAEQAGIEFTGKVSNDQFTVDEVETTGAVAKFGNDDNEFRVKKLTTHDVKEHHRQKAFSAKASFKEEENGDLSRGPASGSVDYVDNESRVHSVIQGLKADEHEGDTYVNDELNARQRDKKSELHCRFAVPEGKQIEDFKKAASAVMDLLSPQEQVDLSDHKKPVVPRDRHRKPAPGPTGPKPETNNQPTDQAPEQEAPDYGSSSKQKPAPANAPQANAADGDATKGQGPKETIEADVPNFLPDVLKPEAGKHTEALPEIPMAFEQTPNSPAHKTAGEPLARAMDSEPSEPSPTFTKKDDPLTEVERPGTPTLPADTPLLSDEDHGVWEIKFNGDKESEAPANQNNSDLYPLGQDHDHLFSAEDDLVSIQDIPFDQEADLPRDDEESPYRERLNDVKEIIEGAKITAFEEYEEIRDEYCFIPETLVLTPMGPREIGSLEEGDTVISCNDQMLACRENVITKVTWHNDREVSKLATSEGDFFVTPEHRFYVKTSKGKHRYLKLEEMHPGDQIRMRSGNYTEVEQIIEADSVSDVVDISVAQDHNFFVTLPEILARGGEDGLHVHNCNPAVAEQLDRAMGFVAGVGGIPLGLVDLAIGAAELGIDLSENPAEVMRNTKKIIDNAPQIAANISDELAKKIQNFDQLSPMEQGKFAGEALSAIITGAAAGKKLTDLAAKELAAYKNVLEKMKADPQRGSLNFGKPKGGEHSNAGAKNRAQHELYKKELRRLEQGEFPKDPNKMTDILGTQPKVSTTQHGTQRMVWEPNKNTRIRYESHPGDKGVPNPRHHSEHYHIETKPDNLTWGQAKRQGKVTKQKPVDYSKGDGTGLLPGEGFPGE